MEVKILIVCFILLELCVNSVTAQDPPFVEASYGAVGELIIRYGETNDTVVLMFEENFDFDNMKAIFTARTAGFSTTLLEDMNLNQTFKYDEEFQGEKIVKTCQIYKSTEWKKVQTPPDLEMFENGDDTVYFPMMQLLWGLSPNNRKKGTEKEAKSYRDIPSDMWLYQINYTTDGIDYVVDVEAYWTNGEWNTSTKETVVPVGFVIRHDGLNKTSGERFKTEQNVNVMYFTQDYFNKEAFLPTEGVFCRGRKSIKPFPSFGNFEGVSANIEFQWNDYQLDSNVDIRIDTTSKTVQVQYDPLDQAPNILNRKQKVSSTLIASYELRVAYDMRGESCKVMWTNDIVDDVQTLYSISELSELTTDHFFGHGVKYIYVGEDLKRGIPCRLWQGLRRGWPKDEPSITTVWEWCIAERTDNPFLPQDVAAIAIINLDITVVESDLTIAMGAYTLGTKFSYGFYHLVARQPSYLRALDFDVSPCFNDSYKEWLQFKVDAKSKQKIIQNATSNADFVDQWRIVIYGATGIIPTSLRVARVKTILAGNVLFVQFLLLDRHPDTPAFVAKGVSVAEAKRRLNSTIDDDALNIDWRNDVLRALKGSLGQIFERKKPPPITEPPSISTVTDDVRKTKSTPVTESKKPPPPTKEPPSTSTVTDDVRKTKSTPVTEGTKVTTPTKEFITSTDGSSTLTTGSSTGAIADPEAQRSPENRHSPGTMAGLGIGMLILGFSLGAGGTFAKFRYFPTLF